MDYYRIGYAMNPALSTMNAQAVRQLTHLNLAFGRIEKGLLTLEMLPDLDRIQVFRQWNPELKIVLSVGGWEADGFSQMAMTEAGRRAFARSCQEAVTAYGLDGIDIDWEYPCSSAAGIASDPRDKENFTLLLAALREELGQEKILSVAMGAAESCVRDTEMDKAQAYLTYVQLMTYDMAGEFPGRTGHHAGLALSRQVVKRYHEAGIPYEKLVLGAAFYGRHFTVYGTENHGLNQRAGEGLPGPAFGELTEDYRKQNGYERFWDEEGEGSYLFNGTTFISYESPESIRRKCAYVKEMGMKGIMYWEQSHDPDGVLLGVIAKELGETLNKSSAAEQRIFCPRRSV